MGGYLILGIMVFTKSGCSRDPLKSSEDPPIREIFKARKHHFMSPWICKRDRAETVISLVLSGEKYGERSAMLKFLNIINNVDNLLKSHFFLVFCSQACDILSLAIDVPTLPLQCWFSFIPYPASESLCR